jgi:coatomer subunit beta'
VIGYDEGTIMIKIGREVPVASMDSSGKIIWAKHNEIQTVNIKSVGADNEVGSTCCCAICAVNFLSSL